MPSTDSSFDWRAFWSDLLQEGGRALLTLDGSDAAQAALAGLDSFDAAQRRRAQEMAEHGSGPGGAPGLASGEELARGRAGTVRVAPAWRAIDSSQMAVPRWPAVRPARPTPMSANPYDLAELPAQVIASPLGLPLIRRR